MKDKLQSLFSTYDENVVVIENSNTSELFEVRTTKHGTYFVCAKELTFGGRENLDYEQRIQIKGASNNFIEGKILQGEKGLLLGVITDESGETVLCTFKVKHSNAKNTISKQIKNETISNAMLNGFAQQLKGTEYACAFRKELLYFYLSNTDWIHDDRLRNMNNHIEPVIAEDDICDDYESERVSTGENVLLYGVPGAGKSWTIEHEYCDDEECMERLVFHPDYMYSDFVGQILPIVKKDDEGKEKVRYEFTPGPFTKIMKKAYEHPTKSFYLVIEEINRGNAPAIFGEIFQLLDRKTEDDDKYKKCTSEYGITNSNIANEVYGDENVKVRIPANLSIIGTMNTSDQNVFTLDTAFQRRWIMRMIPNSFSGHKFAKNKILDTDVSWQQFCEAINEEILRRNNVTSSEDKRLGAYFVSSDDLICRVIPDGCTEKEKIKIQHMNARFAEKVLKYLWDDAFKFSHADTFDTKKYKSLEKVVEGFNSSTANDRFKVFHENLRKMIIEGLDDNNMISDEDDN